MSADRCPACKRPMPVKVKRVRTKARRGPMRDANYRRWCKEQSCVIAPMIGSLDCQQLTDPAHTENNGMRSKGPDSSCVPLCRKHHVEYDAGRAAFEKKYGVNMAALAREHYARYLTEIAGSTRV